MANQELNLQELCMELNRKLTETEARVKAEAKIRRAFMDKVSKDAIDRKVNAQLNSIKIQINQINPKFKEGSKHFEEINELIDKTMIKYKDNLEEVSKFYDTKIEQLILRKVELEAGLIGALFNKEYLDQRLKMKKDQKENDSAKKSIKENIKELFEKFKVRKKEKTIVDSKDITKMMDVQDIAMEMEQKLTDKVNTVEEGQKQNFKDIVDFEKELLSITEEIEKINERKQTAIDDAMEVGDKAIDVNIRKPRLIKKITRFFASKFNAAKVIETSVINPLNERIDSYLENELAAMKE